MSATRARIVAVALAVQLGAAPAGLASDAPVPPAPGSTAAPSRKQEIARTLLAQHRDLLARDRAAVAEKLARMAKNPFNYFRGAGALLPSEPSRFVTPASAKVAVVGDPHPENIGTFRGPGGTSIIDFNDFDRAGFGSYVSDLRHLALGLWLVADMADLGHKQRAKVVRALCQGYLEQIRTLGQGGPPLALRAETTFGGVEAILAAPPDEELGFARGTPWPAAQMPALQAGLERYRATLVRPETFPSSAFVIKRASKLNTGISSFPLLRIRVEVEGLAPGNADDWTLELKQHLPIGGGPSPSAAAVIALQRQFQERPDDDPWLGWTELEGRELRVRRVSPEQRRLSVERLVHAIEGPSKGKKDLRALAASFGGLLARGHARALGADGKPGLAAVRAAVGDGEALSDEMVEVTARAAEQVKSDLKDLRALLRENGPTLDGPAVR